MEIEHGAVVTQRLVKLLFAGDLFGDIKLTADLRERIKQSDVMTAGGSVYGEGRIGTERVILAKPLTFMNNSGWAVRDLVNWFKIEHDQLIVIYDDIDLDPGDLRIREKGSSGSHNGMKSVIYQLGFDDFPRIRVGVGAPEGGRDLIAHVMSMPSGEALDKVKAALNDAADAAELMVSGRIADAQMRFNKKPKRKKKEEAKKAEAENAEQKGETKDE